MKKICVVTGTRAEYGLLYPVMKQIQSEPTLELQLVATGAHLSPEFGLTYRNIERDGFTIDARVEMLLASDTAVGVAKSIGLGVIGFAETLDRLKPDIMVVLGDRYEILAAVQAAMTARIPIAHIAGGDTTEGAIDEAIRHSITKMAHLHFVTNAAAAKRVRQMGENPDHIHCVGSPGIDAIKGATLLSRRELTAALGFTFREKNLLVTFHPVTLEGDAAKWQIEELLKALDSCGPTVGIIITKPNSDMDGRIIAETIDQYAAGRSNVKAFVSLGQLNYLSAIAQVDAVVGNSSSGLYEVPSFKKPTVNVGDRQKGRLAAKSVIHCGNRAEEIREAISQAFRCDCSDVKNPYGEGDAAVQIVATLNAIDDHKKLLKKHFFAVEADG